MATLRRLRRSLTTPFALVLLLLTLGTVYLLLQWTLLTTDNSSKAMRAAFTKLHQPVLQFTEDFLKRYDYDYLKCKRLAAEVTSLEDMKRVTSSYLVTLADLEDREHLKLDELELLQASVQQLKDTVSRLTAKSVRLKHSLLAQVLRANQIEAQLIADQNSLDDLVHRHQQYVAVNNEAIQPRQRVEPAYSVQQPCSIDACFNYTKCQQSTSRDKLRVHVLDRSEAFFQPYLDQRSGQVARSVELVSEPSDACLVLVSLDPSDKDLPTRLSQLHTNQPDLNFMLVLPSPSNSTNNLTGISSPLASLQLEWPELHRKLTDSLICSLERPTALAASHGDLWVPFSLLSDAGYLAKLAHLATNSLVDYLHERDHLVSFHAQASSQFLGRDLVAGSLATGSRRFELDLECSSGPDCGSLSERLDRLRRAQFTLIAQPANTTWSSESTRRLLEALSCGTLPVLVGMSARPPLSGLVAWSDILIQIPLARLHQLGRILSELDRAQITARQVRASNVYTSYFATNTAMSRTLFAAVQHQLHLEIAPLAAYSDAKAITFSGRLICCRDPFNFG